MTLIKSILENEIKDVLGHKPTQIEYKSCFEYIMEMINIKDGKPVMLVDIELAVRYWRHDECIQCKSCGDYFLPEEMYYEDFCSDYCRSEWLANQKAEAEFRQEAQSRWNER